MQLVTQYNTIPLLYPTDVQTILMRFTKDGMTVVLNYINALY